jgi:hypothetical protein
MARFADNELMIHSESAFYATKTLISTNLWKNFTQKLQSVPGDFSNSLNTCKRCQAYYQTQPLLAKYGGFNFDFVGYRIFLLCFARTE